MKKFTKIIALVLALVCICTAFAACGGNKDDGNTTKTPAVKVIDYDLTNEQYAFGVDKNQPELLTQVNDIIKEMKSDYLRQVLRRRHSRSCQVRSSR